MERKKYKKSNNTWPTISTSPTTSFTSDLSNNNSKNIKQENPIGNKRKLPKEYEELIIQNSKNFDKKLEDKQKHNYEEQNLPIENKINKMKSFLSDSRAYLKNYAKDWMDTKIVKYPAFLYEESNVPNDEASTYKQVKIIPMKFKEIAEPITQYSTILGQNPFVKEEPPSEEKTSVFDEQSLPSSKNDEIAKANVPFIKEEPVEFDNEIPEIKKEINEEDDKSKLGELKNSKINGIKSELVDNIEETTSNSIFPPLLSIPPFSLDDKPPMSILIPTPKGMIVHHLGSTSYKNRRSITIKRADKKQTITLIKNFAMVLSD